MATITNYIFYGLIALFVLLLVIYFGSAFIKDIQNYNSNMTWLVNGTQLARSPRTISGSDVPASTSGAYGIEFTYMQWLYINDILTKKNQTYEPILIKGSSGADGNGLPYIASPAILLGPNGNEITVAMNILKKDKSVLLTGADANKSVESITIDNIPMDKWFQLVVVLMNNKLDIYINGQIRARKEFSGIPDINNADLHLASNNGFDGFISNAIYYSNAVPYYKIDQHLRAGPSQKPCDLTGTKPPYLAPNYWTNS
jgi:hypothetical protein